ncbi:hypothetical protein HS088_TW10G00933 [Tripterygium wilfordii]|uniref:Uncharacterized protein n=1 Tax=Tripterygium wilfordii TaxID=458696 RepID=A0A7J7D6E0_TRIWF|nr:UPF0301 protein Plut_0637 [Tripterygium wilfordii]KAF5741925.1 hypothetical protein HS088_TW10G00933 [Tripterygium wilfordii]
MMDPWTMHVKIATTTTPSSFWLRNSICEKAVSGNLGRVGVFEIGVSRRSWLYSSGSRSLVVKAMGKKNNGNSSSSSSSPGNNDSGKNSPEGNKSNDPASPKSHHISLDWREFRANLFAQEKAEKLELNAYDKGGMPESKPLGLKWAHPIPVPETGCLLVATEKLDFINTFQRTVVLLLRSGTRNPQEGPFGVIINKPLHKKIKHMSPTNNELASTFADCSVHFGGPLNASMFLLRTREKSKLPGVEEVMPGLCFGARNCLDEAAELVKKGVLKPQDFRFFYGYAGWQLDQLREEIESDFWYVAACSPNLIFGGPSSSSENSWEEILQLMGGHYSELSRKPKQDM